MASDYLKSLKGSFDPVKKSGSTKSKLGRPSAPVLNQNPRSEKLSLGKR